jgi:hypothetical protein
MTQDETDAAINRRVMELEILAYHTGLAYRHLWHLAPMPSCPHALSNRCRIRRGSTASDSLPMSAFLVAIGGKADMPFCTAYVRF